MLRGPWAVVGAALLAGVVGDRGSVPGRDATLARWGDAEVSSGGALRFGAVTIRTAAFGRGEAAGPAIGAARRDADGSVAIDRGLAVERFRPEAAGVEQTFEFAAPPEGRGDLVVRVGVEGQRHGEPRAGGFHFDDAAGGRGIRYGAATWVDGRGARTAIASSLDAQGGIELRVPADVLEHSTYPAVLDPIVEIEITKPVLTPLIDASIVAGGVASNGSEYLVTWVDERAGVPTVWATRLDAGGNVLDPTGIEIASEPGAEHPVVASNGGSFFVAWTDERKSPPQVYGTGVDPSGGVQTPGGYPLRPFEAQWPLVQPAITALGARYFVAFEEHLEARGVLVDFDGNTSAPVTLASTLGDSPSVALAAGPGNALLVVVADRTPAHPGLLLRRYPDINDTSTHFDDVLETFPTATAASPPAAIYDGTQYVVAWHDDSQLGDNLSLGYVPTTWPLVGPTIVPAVHSGLTVPSIATEPGGNTWIVYNDSAGIFPVLRANAFDTAGNPIAALTLRPQPVIAHGVACLGGMCLTSWPDLPSRALVGQLFDDAEVVGTPFGMASAATKELSPAVAAGPSSVLVALADRDQSLVRAARFLPGGVPIDLVPLDLDIAKPADALRVRAAFGGGQFFVVYGEVMQSTMLVRVPEMGSGAAAPTVVGACSALPDIACGESTCLTTCGSQDTSSPLSAIRIDAVGDPLDAPPIAFEDGAEMAVAFGASTYLVAYRRDGGHRQIVARLVPEAGAPGIVFPITKEPIDHDHVAVAFDGDAFVVAWGYDDGATRAVHAARVTPDGTVVPGDGVQVAETLGPVTAVMVAATGDVGTSVIGYQVDEPNTGNAAHITSFAGGAPQASFDLDATDHTLAELVGGPGHAGSAFVGYTRFDAKPAYRSRRARAHVLQLGAVRGTSCTDHADCASNACADGVCCDTRCDGPCQACSHSGTCVPTSGNDSQCHGAQTCKDGLCLAADGGKCMGGAECASGFCDSVGICCDVKCDDGCDRCDDAGACVPLAKGEGKCAPYVCDGTSRACPSSCGADEDCADGFHCAENACVAQDTRCAADGRTVISPDGTERDCSPYRCAAGHCTSPCDSTLDCLPGNLCNADGTCGPAPDGGAVAECAAAPGGAGSPAGWGALGLALVAAALRRARRGGADG